jgi:acyl-CoA thioester hydrolase
LRAEQGIVFAVRRLEADYLRPAKFDDELVVETRLHHATGARIVLDQDVMRQGERLFAAQVTLVCLGDDGHPVRLPPDLRLRLGAGMH